MIAILWSYEVRPAALVDFDRAYGPDGDWALLFRRGEGYLGTELFRGPGGARLTLDRWRSRADFEAFMEAHGADYSALDRATEGWTIEERRLGTWEAVARPGRGAD
jgi:heme-degrading monooxygenase HmoA